MGSIQGDCAGIRSTESRDWEVVGMFTRVLTVRGAENIDDGVGVVRENVPVLRELKGYRGVNASADRDGGVFGILSLWETEAYRDASLDALAGARQQGLDVLGGDLTVENFE